MIVLGIDPGKLTGLCILQSLPDGEINFVSSDEIPFEDIMKGRLESEFHWRNPMFYGPNIEVAYEKYVITEDTLRKSRTDILWSVEVISNARYLCTQYNSELFKVNASSSKRLITDDKIERLGWKLPGEGHAKDAVRVALTHIAQNHPKRFGKFLKKEFYSGN